MSNDSSGAQIGQLSESDLSKLLNEKCGFKYNRHRNNVVSWDWIHNDKRLVERVVRWKHFASDSNEPSRIAADLGLSLDELQEAVNGAYTGSCLRLVFFIYQVHRHLEILGAQARKYLIENSDSFFEAIGNEFGPRCRSLLTKQQAMINDISKHPDTKDLGQALAKMIANLP